MALDGAYDHGKIRRLSRALHIKPWAALGLMEAIWGWARKSARHGRIESEQWEDLADRLQWEDPSENLRAVLVRESLIDAMDGWDWIHDWHEHADNTLRRYLEKRHECFANGAPARRPDGGYEKSTISKVETINKKVEQNGKTAQPPTRVKQPEPEPEPEAAALRVACARGVPIAAALTPKPDHARISEVLHRATPRQRARPPADIVRRVVGLIGSATAEQLETWLVERARSGGTEPRKYIFWLRVIAQDFRIPEPASNSPPCATCHGNGWVCRGLHSEMTLSELDAATKPCPGCAKGAT